MAVSSRSDGVAEKWRVRVIPGLQSNDKQLCRSACNCGIMWQHSRCPSSFGPEPLEAHDDHLRLTLLPSHKAVSNRG